MCTDSEKSKSVFILYCNDEEMGEGFSQSVRELANFLIRACGSVTQVHTDFYLTTPPANWPRWTEHQIKTSDTVLLVCSKTLQRILDSQNYSRPVPMIVGHFYAETVYNLIRSPKFIPVFVNHSGLDHFPDLFHTEPYSNWVPSQLGGAHRYWVDLRALHRDMREIETEEKYREELAGVLGQVPLRRELEPIARLLRVLQRTPDTPRPTPFSDPILPPTGAHT